MHCFFNIKYSLIHICTGWILVISIVSGADTVPDARLQGTGTGILQGTTFTDISSTISDFGYIEGSHGVFFADANNDGKVDLYITTYVSQYQYLPDNNSNDYYLLNQTSGSTIAFSWQSSSPVKDFDGGSHGGSWADLDNDGDYDLINGGTIEWKYTSTSLWGPEENAIYENNGSGVFTDESPSVMSSQKRRTRAVVAIDMEGDGDLDIFTVSGYKGTDDDTLDSHNEIYLNNGSGTINTAFSRIGPEDLWSSDACQGATLCDYDNDGDCDLFAANRTGLINMLNNVSGTFTLVGSGTHGINVTLSDGITFGDVDNDGDFDVIINDDGNYGVLYKNNLFNNPDHWPTTFTLRQSFSLPGYIFNGYSGALGDMDNDGDLDLMFAGDDTIWVNDGLGGFSPEKAIDYPLGSEPIDPRGMALADVDNDGDLDIVSSDKDYTNTPFLLVNNLSNSNHYLKVKLVSPQGQAGAFGAKVYVTPANQAGIFQKRGGELPQVGLREARGNFGYVGQNDPVLHFGLGSRTSVDVAVEFLGGYRATRTNVAADQVLTIDRADVRVAVKVFLEGPYDATGDSMKTDLNSSGYLDTESPHDGRTLPEGVPTDDIVDWVYIQLRETTSGSAVASKSALLRNDGMVVADDGVTEYITMNAEADDYYIVVDHRNHVKVMSANVVSLDYTSSTLCNLTATGQVYGSGGMKEIETSIWGMWAGDANNNGQIQIDDKNDYWWSQAGTSGYQNGDFNLNGQVQIDDKNDYWWINAGIGTQVP